LEKETGGKMFGETYRLFARNNNKLIATYIADIYYHVIRGVHSMLTGMQLGKIKGGGLKNVISGQK